MGRKPNPIILEYFNRGPKLEDASNRYQHTCKSCGERFPKGRIDSLVTHLTKKCTALSREQRREIVLRLHDVGTQIDFEQSPHITESTRLERGKNVNLPFSPSRQFDRLNVLAEASRQVGATDQNKPPAYTSAQQDGNGVIVDPALEVTGLDNAFLNPPEEVHASTAHGPSYNNTPAPPLPSIFSYHPHQTSTNDSPHLPGLSLLAEPPSSTRPIDLSSIAASANETLANVMIPQEPGIGAHGDQISPSLFHTLSQYHPAGLNQNNTLLPKPTVPWTTPAQGSISEMLADTHSSKEMSSQDAQRAATLPRPIAISPNIQTPDFITEFGTAVKSQKPKVRGRFSADRRKQVQQVRKKGACIRCRFLKKPCSGETPCLTCQNVESARLWKSPCKRTRIVDEFTLYSTGLHSALAYRDVSSVKASVQLEHFSGLVEVFHYENPSYIMTFSALTAYKGRENELPSVLGIAPLEARMSLFGETSTDLQEIVILDGEADDLTTKLERYMKEMAVIFHERESSQIVKSILGMASARIRATGDSILVKVLDLWTATHILSDLELEWKTFINSNMLPANHNAALQHDHLAMAALSSKLAPINELSHPYSYALICCQLRAAVEKRASQLSKLVMNDFERRLLERFRSGKFETFLIALILLNCAERTCWLFRTWDTEQHAARWPLDQRPNVYADQGEQLSDILQMLLKMRDLPPKTSPRPDNGVLKTIEGSDESATRFFEEIQITQSFLDQCQAAVFDNNNSRSLDGKFFSKILQPKACYT